MSASRRYFEWDYDNDVVIEYTRSGECCECGACCMTIIRFKIFNKGFGHTNPIAGWNSHNGEFINPGIGIVNDIEVDGKHRYFWDCEVTDEPTLCPMLTEDKRCKVHIGKALLHREWPMSPKQVTPFDDCTYSFTEVARWKISDLRDEANNV